MMNDGVYGHEDMELLSIINKIPFDKKIKDKSQLITMNKGDLTRFISVYTIILIILVITYTIYSIFFSESFIIGMSIPVGSLIIVALKKYITKLHEKLHIAGGKFKLDDVDIILDENGGGTINIKKWILVSRTTALRFFIYPWIVLVLIPLIIFIIFINYSIVWFIIPFLIMESFGCYIDVYKFFLILKNSERRDKIIIVPSNLNYATVIRVGGN